MQPAQPTPSSPSPSPASPSHVFVIVMENRSYDQAIAGGYTAKLAQQFGVATNYHAVSHPSLPNYLALTSGSTWGIADDGYHALPASGLGQQLTQAGITWRAYMEGMSGTCFSSPYPYALKHDPFPYYGGKCPAEVQSLGSFAPDMAGADAPRFVWISPGLCNDGHDCSTAVADRYLARIVPQIMATAAWQQNGVLFITWDEGEDSSNHVLTLVIRPGGAAQQSKAYHDHYSLLATVEDLLGVPRLGQAAKANTLRELLVSGSAS
ncbi:MAG TPA: alkaline phosphatase family protein [Candidatus Dormibacteraeota bacterium]|nr:alkaline phosphatase family protein [Candidatus Dormibacteraeota bacterium]